MNDSNNEQRTTKTEQAKSIDTVQTTKAGGSSGSLSSTTPVARKKRWLSAGLIIPMSLGAIAILIYLLRHEVGEQYDGFGIALCAIACGLLLVRHFLGVLSEEDKLDEEQLNANPAADLPSEPNPPEQK
jgi:hypothetical protein